MFGKVGKERNYTSWWNINCFCMSNTDETIMGMKKELPRDRSGLSEVCGVKAGEGVFREVWRRR